VFPYSTGLLTPVPYPSYAQYINSHVDLQSEAKVHHTKSSLEDLAEFATWVGMVHYVCPLKRISAKKPCDDAYSWLAPDIDLAFG